MSTTIQTERGGVLTVAVGPFDGVERLVRVEVLGPVFWRSDAGTALVGLNLTRAEAVDLADALLGKVGPCRL